MKRKPSIDAATARKLAVDADCDPRTIKRVLEGTPVHNIATRRAYDALVRAGLLKMEKAG